ncbi:MAG: helix-turn-helix domain containing protein [Sulfurovum sp.]|nr:helix-turn-helix domain containing protein [Sulfurovum sp.]
MIPFPNVITRLKSIIGQRQQQSKVRDMDVAAALGLDPQYFAVIKRRNKIPYEAIARFCEKERISMNWVLLEQAPRDLT